MTTKDATALQTDEIDSAENNPNTAATAKDSDLNENTTAQTITKDSSQSKVNGTDAVSKTGFRMKLNNPLQQCARKRKRPAKAATAHSAPVGTNASSLNVFGDDDDDDITKRSRSHKLLTMSLSGSSSSSDEDDGPSIPKAGLSNKDLGMDFNVDHRSEGARPQHETVPSSEKTIGNDCSKNSTEDETNSPIGPNNVIEGHNNCGNESTSTNSNDVTTEIGNGDNSNLKSNLNDPKKVNVIPNNGSQLQQQHQIRQQPEGWRVKLYRLNADGSWDDCGTGRILCLYKLKSPLSSQNPNHKNDAPNANYDSNIDSNENNSTSENNDSSYNSTSNNANDPNSDSAIYIELGEPTLCMHSEISSTTNKSNNASSSSMPQQSSINQSNNSTNKNENTTPQTNSNNGPRILLRTRILLRDAYQRQGDNIITWCEPYLEEGNPAQGVDLALSFQDNAGCIDIWRQITQVQSKANEKFRLRQNQQNTNASGNLNGTEGSKTTASVLESNESHDRSLADLAHNVAAAHHANLHQQRQELWANVAAEGGQGQQLHGNVNNNQSNDDHHAFDDAMGGIVAAYRDAAGGGTNGNTNALGGTGLSSPQLPSPPTIETLEEIADTIATVQHMQQRESLAMFISQNDCFYLKSLLSLFPPAEDKGDYGSLATLAACVKTILLLNDPSILELIVNDELVFEDVCTALEYDPDLRDKANHRWFLRERAKFRTVALMKDEELVGAIHRSFRVNYLKDTLLRPTMDESSLSTLSSLQTFTHADVVKGVTMSQVGSEDRGDLLKDSYLAKVIRTLGHEMDEICNLEWKELEALQEESFGKKSVRSLLAKRQREESLSSASRDQSTVIVSGKYSQKLTTIWKQHLAPQDDSMSSRRIRRRGSLSFLRELFNMVRVSLHQNDKDDFFAVLVSMEVDLSYRGDAKSTTQDENVNKKMSSKPNFLMLLATVLSDPETDVTDKGLVLEIIAGIAMHDPSLIRRKCLEFYASCKNERLARPMPNEKKQVVFHCPPNDLLASLLFLLAMETDAGVLLQVSEIMRIILDTDVMGDNRPMNTGFADEAEGIPPSGVHNPPHDQHPNPNGSGSTTSTEQNKFLSAFYEHYVQWLAAPFQFTILYPLLRVPTNIFHGNTKSKITQTMIHRFEKGEYHDEPLLHRVPFSALRSSFAVELLSFCVKAHQYRMKMYILRSQVLGKVLKGLKVKTSSGDRCLKLAALRFLRAVLSVEEDSYYRHIIQDDLFGPVFEAFRENPVGDNLVSSSIVEMCDFINSKRINSLIEYIVTKHILATGAEAPLPSLEDVSSPYVSTLTCLRHAHEELVRGRNTQTNTNDANGRNEDMTNRIVTNEKALEDQRKFRQVDQEESYFDCDDDDDEGERLGGAAVDTNMVINPLGQHHKTPRIFSLTQADIPSGNPNSGGNQPCL